MPSSMEEATMLADIRDYFMYLVLDGLEDPSLARRLVDYFSQAWLGEKARNTAVWHPDFEAVRFYLGWIFGLERLLSLRHRIAKLPGEKITREDFIESWRQTAKKLGF